jgi:hypothetical protein
MQRTTSAISLPADAAPLEPLFLIWLGSLTLVVALGAMIDTLPTLADNPLADEITWASEQATAQP